MSKNNNSNLAAKLQQYEAEGVRPFFVVVSAVIFKDDKVLIARRYEGDGHAPGKWCIPGGKVEVNADKVFNLVESTLFREISEEVGVEVESDFMLITNNTFVTSDGRNMLSLVFAADWVSGEATPKDEVDKVAWIAASEMGDYEFSHDVRDYLHAAFSLLT